MAVKLHAFVSERIKSVTETARKTLLSMIDSATGRTPCDVTFSAERENKQVMRMIRDPPEKIHSRKEMMRCDRRDL